MKLNTIAKFNDELFVNEVHCIYSLFKEVEQKLENYEFELSKEYLTEACQSFEEDVLEIIKQTVI